MKANEIVKKLNEDVVAINLASMFGGMPQSYQERATCYKAAADLIEGLIPRPIEEINEIDGVGLCMYGDDIIVHYGAMMKGIHSERLNFEPLLAIKNDGTDFDSSDYTHFIPLSAIQKLMEGGE